MVSIHDRVLDVWTTEYFNDGERSCMTVVVKLLHVVRKSREMRKDEFCDS